MGLLVTLGIIFGDIGTSPLYVLKAIVGDAPINNDIVLGSISCIFWTLTLQTTLKYVIITLRADNKGEGGIFSLYALVRRTRVKWLLVPAIIGGSTLLADGIITPPISVSSAIEGLRIINPDIETVPIVIGIITGLFFIQQFGTSFVGKFFGPVMLIWFLMLGTLGVAQLVHAPWVLKALSPYYAYDLIINHNGFLLLGAVFLCTTGAEALYSDLGHCGKKNIRVSWMLVKACLLLNYFGQAAWLVQNEGKLLSDFEGNNPFYSIMPHGFLYIGIAIATLATIIASQALITGSFTLINEAIRLNFWPKVRIAYPSNVRGQLYIPSVNWLLWAGCVGIVLYFRDSSHMEAAYGMAIVLTMLMTTLLLAWYMYMKRYNKVFMTLAIITYIVIEGAFFAANLHKFNEGGWLTLLIATVLVSVMWIWYAGRRIKNRFVDETPLNPYVPLLADLSNDLSIPKYATHLVYLTGGSKKDEIEQKIIYSILQKQPKRADIYWFVHVEVTDDPYRMEYKVTEIVRNDIVRVDFRLGFRIEPKINMLFRLVVQDMVKRGEVDITSRYESLNRNNIIGDFRFVVLEKFLSNENVLSVYERLVLKGHFILKRLGVSEKTAFGLDTSAVTVEKVPLIISPVSNVPLKRIE